MPRGERGQIVIERGVEWICRVIFGESASLTVCKQLLLRVIEKGYAPLPARGLEYYVAKRLVERGVLQEFKVDECLRRYRPITILTLNVEHLTTVYEALRRAQPPPLCYHYEEVKGG